MLQALLNALGSRNTTTEDAAYDDSLEEQPDDDIVRVTTRNVRRRDPSPEEEARRPTQWVAWRISHAHKHRCREWVAARFPDCTLEQNAKDALLFSASDAAAVVAALAKDEHAARHVHACAAHGGSTARLEDVPGLAEAAYDAAAATAARLRVRGAPGLKEALLKNLPERIQLTPRGASHELVVDAVPATHATYYYVGCAPLAETFVPSTGDAGDVCRAVHKLREAMVRFALPPFRRVVDVGAAPGGWSQVCLEHGAELVVAVDPADLLRHARLFAALPYLFSAMKITVGMSVIGAIVAEFTGANQGIGTIIVNAGYRQGAVMLFSAIFVTSAATVIFFYAVVLLEKLALFWPGADIEN